MRQITRRRRQNGKFDLVVTFFRGNGDARRQTAEYTVYEDLGPRQVEQRCRDLQSLLDTTYADGYAAARDTYGR